VRSPFLFLYALVLFASCSSTSQLVLERTDVGSTSADRVLLRWSRPEAVALRWDRPERIPVHSVQQHSRLASPLTDPVEPPSPKATAPTDSPCKAKVEVPVTDVPTADEGEPITSLSHDAEEHERSVEPAQKVSDDGIDGTTRIRNPSPTEEYPVWNALCVVAFAACMLGLVGVFLLNGPLVAMLLLGLVLGIAGHSQAKERDQQGKAFAVIAIVVAIVFALLFLLVLLTFKGLH
jgi:hypothetical protein